MTYSDTYHTTDHNDEEEIVDVRVEYSIETPEHETGYAGGWDIHKIWYGNTRYNSLEDLRQVAPDCAMEIELHVNSQWEEEN